MIIPLFDWSEVLCIARRAGFAPLASRRAFDALELVRAERGDAYDQLPPELRRRLLFAQALAVFIASDDIFTWQRRSVVRWLRDHGRAIHGAPVIVLPAAGERSTRGNQDPNDAKNANRGPSVSGGDRE